MAVTVRTICTQALRKIKVLAAGEAIEETDLTDMADELRRMLDTWRLEPMMILVETVRSFDLSPLKNTYTYYDDAAADFEAVRPVVVLAATMKNADGFSYPLDTMTAIEWSESSNRTIVGRPTRFFYHAAFPIADLRLDCLPDDAWPTIELVTQEPFEVSTVEADWDDDLTFAPGYEDCMIYNLGVRVAGDFSVSPPQGVLAFAASFKALVKRANFDVPELVIEHGRRGLRGTYDITAGPVR